MHELPEPIAGLYQALQEGDLDRACEFVAPNVQWRSSPMLPWGRRVETRSGRDGVRSYLEMLGAALDARVEVTEVLLCGDDCVVVIGEIIGTARQTEAPFECRFAHVFWIENDLIVRHRGFPDTAAVLAAMGEVAT